MKGSLAGLDTGSFCKTSLQEPFAFMDAEMTGFAQPDNHQRLGVIGMVRLGLACAAPEADRRLHVASGNCPANCAMSELLIAVTRAVATALSRLVDAAFPFWILASGLVAVASGNRSRARQRAVATSPTILFFLGSLKERSARLAGCEDVANPRHAGHYTTPHLPRRREHLKYSP